MAVTFAKRFILDVRMSYAVVGRCRNRIECHDAIVPGMSVAQITPGELNLKSPQINPFKFDGLSRDRNLLRLEVDVNIVELVIQRNQVVVNMTEVADRRTICVIDDGIVDCLERTPELADCSSQTITNSRGRCKPMSLVCHIELACESFTALYLIGWHRH